MGDRSKLTTKRPSRSDDFSWQTPSQRVALEEALFSSARNLNVRGEGY